MPSKDEIVAFSARIEKLSNTWNQNHMSVMDAIVYHCEKIGLEIDVAGKLLTPDLKKKLQVEAVSLRMMPPDVLIPKKRKKRRSK